ncbi:BMP family ABC transporter substrate-binding protein [Microbacterium caowuchunii]|nr:BMP family ABC transporter substrate-binding protein [Microbacterium caowuchunii]
MRQERRPVRRRHRPARVPRHRGGTGAVPRRPPARGGGTAGAARNPRDLHRRRGPASGCGGRGRRPGSLLRAILRRCGRALVPGQRGVRRCHPRRRVHRDRRHPLVLIPETSHCPDKGPVMRLKTLSTAAAVAATAALVLTGCAADSSSAEPAAAASDVIRVGALTPGNANDGAFNQALADALARLADEGLIEYELREQMADPATSEPVIADFASQGFDLIVGHGIELGDAIFSVAEDFPDVDFTASGGVDILEKGTDNVETWTYDATQVGYLSGYIAGLTGAAVVGRVESMELDFVKVTDEFFQLGVAAANPAATLLPVVYAGSFDDAEAAASATKGLIDQGADLVYTTGDGIAAGVGAAAAEAGVLSVGVSPAAGEAALATNVSTVDLDMYPILKAWIDEVRDGGFGGDGVVSTLANGGLTYKKINDVEGRVPSDVTAKVDELIAGISDGSITIP